MTDEHSLHPAPRPGTPEVAGAVRAEEAHHAPGHSLWWMVVCCAPMVLLVLAILLGVFGPW